MTSIDEVKAALERSNGVRIMVLDACRNNPLAQRLVRSITVNTRDIQNVQGYARPEKTQGMVVIYATQADDVANDGTGRNSPFSAAFLKEIKEPGLEIGTMFRRIGEDVYQATNGRQSPELSISMVPEYYLNQQETDQAIWARIRVSADADTIREFLSRYPNSFYAPDAKSRLELLDQTARGKAADQQLEKQKQEAAAAEAARLKQEQGDRERIAAEARAREQELSAKLAAVESERQRMAAELAEKSKAQSDVDQHRQIERAKADDERQQREAALRAEIEQRKAASSQLEKDRLLQEALARDREKQAADEKAAAERDRIAKENSDRELQAQLDRAQALKIEVARLEQDAAQATANAQAEAQKAADAQKAASDAEKTAALTPPPASHDEFSAERVALVAPIQTELRRLGCYFGADEWYSAAMKRGVARFAQYAKLASAPDSPSASLLDDLKARRDRICPSECSPRETEVGGRCVAKTCGRGEFLSRTGACVAKPAAPREAVAKQRRKRARYRRGIVSVSTATNIASDDAAAPFRESLHDCEPPRGGDLSARGKSGNGGRLFSPRAPRHSLRRLRKADRHHAAWRRQLSHQLCPARKPGCGVSRANAGRAEYRGGSRAGAAAEGGRDQDLPAMVRRQALCGWLRAA